jgi:hypothetical protein
LGGRLLIVLGPILLLAEPLAATQNTTTAAVSGVVVEGNTNATLAGASVTLRAGNRTYSTVTDRRGRFVFIGLPPSDRYVFTAALAGYFAGATMQRSAFHPGARLTLAAGEWRSDIVLDLWPLASLTGFIVDERFEPVVDAHVQLLGRRWVAGASRWIPTLNTRTDDRGRYHLGGLQHGEYIVHVPMVFADVGESARLGELSGFSEREVAARRILPPQVASISEGGRRTLVGDYPVATPEGGRPRTYRQTFLPSAWTTDDAQVIRLVAGENRIVPDLILEPVRAYSVAGRVFGPPDVVNGLSIRLVPVGSEALGPGAEQAATTAQADGTFRFPVVPEGDYFLDASTTTTRMQSGLRTSGGLPRTPGRPLGTLTLSIGGDDAIVTMADESRSAHSGQLAVTVAGSDVEGLQLVLTSGVTVSGTVSMDDGTPIPKGVTVIAESASADPLLPRQVSRPAVTNESPAQLVLHGLFEGEYVLRADAIGTAIRSIQSSQYIGNRLIVTDGTNVDDVVITLTRDVPRLSGVVRSDDGNALPAAAVLIFPVEPNEWQTYGASSTPVRIRSRPIFGSERYQVADLPAGEYFVVAVTDSESDAWRDPRFLKAAASVAERVALDWGDVVQRDLTIRKVIVR